MSKTLQISLDGLSRCLCPLIDGVQRTSAHRRPILLTSKRLWTCTDNPAPLRHHGRSNFNAAHKLKSHRKPKPANESKRLKDDPYGPVAHQFPAVNRPIEVLHKLLRLRPDFREGAFEKTTALVRHLIFTRREKPSLIHYDALIAVNADPERGSAAVVEGLLGEMKTCGIVPDAALYHKVLQALSMHPNYVLRAQVLEEMRDRWIDLNPDGYQSLILGLLRDHQFELALTTLEQAQKKEVPLKSYVYDIILYVLINGSELDTALTLLQSRVAKHDGSVVSDYVWYCMLGACASTFHYPGVKYIWGKRVEKGFTTPHDGMCTSILNTAARNGDVDLATDVIRVLSNRNVSLDFHHYEALLEAYVEAEQPNTAMRVLCIMKKTKLEPESASTRELVRYLQKAEGHLSKAWGNLKRLKEEGYTIPTAAANAVLEALSFTERFRKAMELYNEFHMLCVDGPNTETFNILFKGCRVLRGNPSEVKALAMFLVAEMRALKVQADQITYDRLIIVCLGPEPEDNPVPSLEQPKNFSQRSDEQDDLEEPYEDAFRYYEEMRRVGGDQNWKPRPFTYRMMIKRCAAKEPWRAQALIQEMHKFRMSTRVERQILTDLGQAFAYENEGGHDVGVKRAL